MSWLIGMWRRGNLVEAIGGSMASSREVGRDRGVNRRFRALAFAIAMLAATSCAPVMGMSEPYPLLGDPDFDVDSLPDETRVWYERFVYALNSSRQFPDPYEGASKGDLYHLGRTTSRHLTTVLTVFRLTGDLTLLDHVDDVMEEARDQLEDTNDDGYLNWEWLHDRRDDHYGDDYHVMDELMTHGMVAEVAWAFHLNRDVPSPAGVDYEERAEFWAEYLEEWEEKWRERNRVDSGFPFIEKYLTHPYISLIRYLWYTYRLTDDDDYLKEATRLADVLNEYELRSIDTANGPGLVFGHGITRYDSEIDYLAPVNYAAYSTQMLMDLALEPFEPFTIESTLIPLANTIATKVIDNGPSDFAPSIGGSEPRAGFDVLGRRGRTEATRWAILPVSEYAAYDDSDTIATINLKVYERLERDTFDKPTRIAIPAAMVIGDLLARE